MLARNCSDVDLQRALNAVNRYYAGNVAFREIRQQGRKIRFTLRTVSSKGPGHTLGHGRPWDNKPGKRLPYACWHVHGHFFDELFKIAPDAGIYSGGSLANHHVKSKWITKEGGNWQDWNAGSQMFPRLASEACECGPLKPSNVKGQMIIYTITADMLKRCPHTIMIPEHYRQDGTCLCFDKRAIDKKQAEREKRRAMIDRIVEEQKGGNSI